MKNILFFLIVLLTILILGPKLYSQPVPMRSIQLNESQISENLLIGINSCNKGLCASCTYLIGELCCSKGVIPLMSMLHNAEYEEIRILAALSLCKIGDARGIYAVKRAAIFDESSRVKRLCALFYNASKSGNVPVRTFVSRG